MNDWKVYERGGLYRIGKAVLVPASTLGPEGQGEGKTYLLWHHTPTKFGPESGSVFEVPRKEAAFTKLEELKERIKQHERFEKDHWKEIER